MAQQQNPEYSQADKEQTHTALSVPSEAGLTEKKDEGDRRSPHLRRAPAHLTATGEDL
jgi:hypothetical protein